MKKVILFFSVLILFFGCNSFIIKRHIVENYYLTAPDVVEQSSLSYRDKNSGSNYLTIVDATVYSVGYDSLYIYLKQYPNYPNKTITNYYIVKRQKNVNYQGETCDPLTLKEFDVRCADLHIKNVCFTIILDL